MRTLASLNRRRYTELAVGALVASLLVGSWSLARTSQDHPRRGESAIETSHAASNKPRKWIVTEDEGNLKSGTADVAGNDTLPALQQIDNGPVSHSVVPYLERIAPPGSSLLSATDYPSLNGATVRLQTPDGDVISLTVHKLSRPISVRSITLGRTPASLSESKGGTQFVEVRTALAPGTVKSVDATGPAVVQLLVSRPAGVLATLTASSAEPGDPVAVGTTDRLPGLLAKAKSVLDVPSIDTIVH